MPFHTPTHARNSCTLLLALRIPASPSARATSIPWRIRDKASWPRFSASLVSAWDEGEETVMREDVMVLPTPRREGGMGQERARAKICFVDAREPWTRWRVRRRERSASLVVSLLGFKGAGLVTEAEAVVGAGELLPLLTGGRGEVRPFGRKTRIEGSNVPHDERDSAREDVSARRTSISYARREEQRRMLSVREVRVVERVDVFVLRVEMWDWV